MSDDGISYHETPFERISNVHWPGSVAVVQIEAVGLIPPSSLPDDIFTFADPYPAAFDLAIPIETYASTEIFDPGPVYSVGEVLSYRTWNSGQIADEPPDVLGYFTYLRRSFIVNWKNAQTVSVTVGGLPGTIYVYIFPGWRKVLERVPVDTLIKVTTYPSNTTLTPKADGSVVATTPGSLDPAIPKWSFEGAITPLVGPDPPMPNPPPGPVGQEGGAPGANIVKTFDKNGPVI